MSLSFLSNHTIIVPATTDSLHPSRGDRKLSEANASYYRPFSNEVVETVNLMALRLHSRHLNPVRLDLGAVPAGRRFSTAKVGRRDNSDPEGSGQRNCGDNSVATFSIGFHSVRRLLEVFTILGKKREKQKTRHFEITT